MSMRANAMRAVLALGLATLAAAPAAAQSASDPVETVRAFYAADDVNAVRFYAKRLRRLFEKDRKEAKGEIGRLGFAFHVNAQDTADGWAKTLRLKSLQAGGDKAEVQALFKNVSPQEIRYDLVLEDGRWLIADARSLKKETWRLTDVLSAPLR